jgi:hypothetical protein
MNRAVILRANGEETRAMNGKDVEAKAREIAGHVFSNATMRAMLFEDIMRAFAPEWLRALQAQEERERRSGIERTI